MTDTKNFKHRCLPLTGKNIYLTTTLPYVNSAPHIGHAFEFLLADTISRYFTLYGDNVFFNIGLDEHGVKVSNKAIELGISPEEHIQNQRGKWTEFVQKFNVGYDSFYTTHHSCHISQVQSAWKILFSQGDIYKKSYNGKYCVGCESFKVDKEIVDGKCTIHTESELLNVSEDNYFFRLSKYKDSLLKWIAEKPEFLADNNKLEELRNLLNDTDDISISRLKENCPWGISVPDDSSQVIYVWFDALLNYIFSTGYRRDNTSENNFDELQNSIFTDTWARAQEVEWGDYDERIQICGSDNLRFQAVIFQGILQSLGLKNTDKLIVHGTILDNNGRKMSKSVGNVVDPIAQLEKYGLDAVRYYALAGLNTFGDSSWNEQELVTRFNNELCNDYGNLISRVLHLIHTKCDKEVENPEVSFLNEIEPYEQKIRGCYESFNIKEAISTINQLVNFGNKYINDQKPWSNDNYIQVLSNLYHLLNVVSEFYAPVIPQRFSEIREALSNKEKVILFEKIQTDEKKIFKEA